MNILEQIEDRRKLVRTRVREVAKGIVPAFFIHGPAGHAKSHMITEELDRVLGKEKWRHHNSYMSAAGLRDELKDHPSSIHFLEDMEPLLANSPLNFPFSVE